MDDSSVNDIKDLLNKWRMRALESQASHYESAKVLKNGNYWLGIPVIIFSTFIGTSIFSTLESSVEIKVRTIIGIVSFLTALLASLQTFLRLAERAERHRSIASKYGAICREIEQVLTYLDSDDDLNEKLVSDIRKELDNISEEAPEVTRRIRKRALEIVGNAMSNKYVPQLPNRSTLSTIFSVP